MNPSMPAPSYSNMIPCSFGANSISQSSFLGKSQADSPTSKPRKLSRKIAKDAP